MVRAIFCKEMPREVAATYRKPSAVAKTTALADPKGE